MSEASRAREAALKPPPRSHVQENLVEKVLNHKATPVLAIPVRKGQVIQRATMAQVAAQQMVEKYKLPSRMDKTAEGMARAMKAMPPALSDLEQLTQEQWDEMQKRKAQQSGDCDA